MQTFHRLWNHHKYNLINNTVSGETVSPLPKCFLQYFDAVGWVFWSKTHYRVGEPTAAWQFVDIRRHRSFDNGRQYVSCGQRQPPLSGATVNKMAVNYHEGETDSFGFRVWWNSSSLMDIFVPPYRQCLTGSSYNNNNNNKCWTRLKQNFMHQYLFCATYYCLSVLWIRDVPNIRFVFASVPNNCPNSLFVFGRIASS